jgi:hypothetical protein
VKFELINRPCVTHRQQILAVAVLASVLCVGVLASWPTGSVAVVHAACGTSPGWCGGSDYTRTSTLAVTHAYNAADYDIPVEPDDTDSYQITAHWSTVYGGSEPLCYCQDVAAQVTADVTWSDVAKSWSVSCSGCSVAGAIYSIGVCFDGPSCGGGATIDNSSGYKLYVDIDQQNLYCCPTDGLFKPAYLSSVAYTTTSVEDGNLINMVRCTEGSSVSPVTQTNSQTDSGPFECTNNCSQSGPSMTIWYE